MSKRSFQFVLALIIGLMFVFGDAFLLFAQETTTEEFTLEEITVTAQKREENQQKVPIFMEVISGDQLAATGKTSIDDILLNTANNIVLKATDGLKVSLRGLAETELPFFDLHASTPTVAIKIDGAYNSSSSAGQSLFDVERVEVLYGPQSTMYASNSPGGIVNIVTIAPKLNKYEAQGSLDIGNFNRTDAQVAFNAPIVGDKLAIRLAAGQTKRDTYVSNSDGFGEDTKKARLKTLYQPNDKLSLTLTLNWSQSGNGSMMGCQVKIFDYQDGTKVTNPWTATDTGGGGGPPGGRPMGPNQAKATTKGVTGEIDCDTGIGNLSIVPQYSKTSSDDQGNYTSDADGLTYTVFNYMRSNTREPRFAWPLLLISCSNGYWA